MKTKTIGIIFGLFLFTGLRLNAQSFKFGFLVGYDIVKSSFTNMPDNPNNPKYYPMISFNANGYIGYKSSGLLGLSVEPGFIRKGYLKKNTAGKVRYQLQYLQMPVLMDMYFTHKLFLSLGPEIAYMLNARIKTKNDAVAINDLYNRQFELSGIIGLNYKITEKVDVGFRYNHGLTYTREIIYTDNVGLLIAKPKEFNQYFQVIVRCKI
jgi:hypothetical protein